MPHETTSSSRSNTGFRFPYDKYEDEIALYENFRYLQEYLRMLGQGDKYATTVIIAASGSHNRSSAHIKCSGVNDDQEIQEALDSLGTEGGEVIFLDGTYNISSNISLPAGKQVSLQGQGATLDFDDGVGILLNGVSNAWFQGFDVTNTGSSSSRIFSGTLQGGADGNDVVFVSGNRFHSMKVRSIFGTLGLSEYSRFIVVNNSFRDIVLHRPVGGITEAAIFIDEGGGSRGSEGIFSHNQIKGITANFGAGNDGFHIVRAQSSAFPVVSVGNNIEDISQLTSAFSGNGSKASHNVVNGVMVAGDHTGTDHGSLSGLGDDDHTQYVLRNILTTRGDVFTRGASAIQRLAIGSTDQILSSDGTDVVWADPPAGAAFSELMLIGA